MEFAIYTPDNEDEMYKQSKAIIKGVIRGTKNLGQLILHPLDNLVYPISELMYDATIITLHHQASKTKNHHPSLYKNMLKNNPSIYVDSHKRMQERINTAKSSIKDFASSSFESQIESITALGTTVLVPGSFLKGVKYFSNTHKFGVGNYSKLNIIGDVSLDLIVKTCKVQNNEYEEVNDTSNLNLFAYPDDLMEYIESKQNNNNTEVNETLFDAEINNTAVSNERSAEQKVLKEQYEMLMQEVPVATTEATKAYKDLVLATEDFNSGEQEVNIRERLVKIAEPIYDFGILGYNISQLAIITGGHKRTWNGVTKVSQASISIASSLTSIAGAKSMLSLGAITGGLGLTIGAIGLIGGLLGEDEDEDQLGEALQQIHQSIIAVHEAVITMHNAMIECFQRVEEVLIVSVVGRLNKINNNLSRLERITIQSFKELHTKDLIDITDAIKKEILGEHFLTNSEKRSYLRRLSCWIDNHSKSSLQTQELRKGGDTSKIIEILSETNLIESLSLFLNELANLVPELPIRDINNLPNYEILSIACDVYMIAAQRPGYYNNIETIKRAQDVFVNIRNITDALSNYKFCDESINSILTRQYDNYRFWVGQFICKIRGNANWSTIESSLRSILVEGQYKTSLFEMLDEMELRRVCLIKLATLFNIKIPTLESKSDILDRPAKNYVQGSIHGVVTIENGLKRHLEMGSNPNIWDTWGKPIHYITKQNSSALDLHLLFKTHPEIACDMSGGTRRNLGDTWGVGSNPILHAMNTGRYDMGVLFCANGFDIKETDGRGVPHGLAHFNSSHMGNAYWWVEGGSVPSIINTRLVKLMNTVGNKLYKDNLRLVYTYYKQMESGKLPDQIDFTLDSLLLLTCVIGDLFPLKYYLYKTQTNLDKDFLNQLIEGLGITYLHFAKACKQSDVVKYFEENGGILDIETEVNIKQLYDENIKNPLLLIWQINTFDTGIITYPVLNSFLDNIESIQLKIKTYLDLASNIPPKSHMSDECLLFRDLLGEIIKTVPRNSKFYPNIKKYSNSLDDAIKTRDVTSICTSFNALNSILSITDDLTSPYTIFSGIANLISDLKSRD
jgi:hypothetical protein